MTSHPDSSLEEGFQPPVRLSRAANMRKVREESMRMANKRRQEEYRDPKYTEETKLEVRNKTQQRSRTAKTVKGRMLLKAAEVENNLVQDKSSRLEIIGADVEALYPPLEAVQVANIGL